MNHLKSTLKQFEHHKALVDKTMAQLSFEDLQNDVAEGTNSIAVLVKHLVGNILSRWTNFLTEDGEKEWRQRDEEFQDTYTSKEDIIADWNKGCACLFEAIKSLSENDLDQIIYIRNEGHTITEAIHRQMMHYSYHIGQIVFIGKVLRGTDWESLSIPKGESNAFNKAKFEMAKSPKYITDDV